MIISSIDIGTQNFAIVVAQIDEKDFTIESILACNRMDIKNTKCNSRCVQHGQKTISHWMFHFFEKYGKFLKKSAKILVEYQKWEFLKAVEQLIQFKFPNKTLLIHPCKLHAFMGTKGLTYDEKKVVNDAKAAPYLKKCSNYKKNSRKHDMSDALCFILLYCKMLKEKSKKNRFSEFRYIRPSKKTRMVTSILKS